ncbi:MAG: DUF2325 domain-containing protein [Desulfovibrionaceae bacterium]|jgi:ABC-type uncharacterized transport system substrate-binding protein
MCATLIGGMDRLKKQYEQTAKQHGVKLKVFTGKERDMRTQMGKPDLIIIFTDKCSHKARIQAVQHARQSDIPVLRSHSCGVSSLNACLGSLGRAG